MAKKTIRLHFTKFELGVHKVRTGNDETTAEIFFDVNVGKKIWPLQSVQVKLTPGADYDKDPGTLEVTGMPKYDGPENYEGFRDCVEAYFRSCVGEVGSAYRIGPTSHHISILGGTVVSPKDCEYEAEIDS